MPMLFTAVVWLEERIRNEALYGKQPDTIFFDECLELYLIHKELSFSAIEKIEQLTPFFMGCTISDFANKWEQFCLQKKGTSAGTRNRYLRSIMAIINFASKKIVFKSPMIESEEVQDSIAIHLSDDVRKKLLDCYSEKSKKIFMTLAYQGLRTQECLQIDWTDIDLKNATIFIRKSKNGESRCVPMHKKIWLIIAREYISQNYPIQGRVFKNRKGESYRDSRKVGGGSPIKTHHSNALKKMKEKHNIYLKFRPHDWRHDWASRMVMSGVDLLTLQKIGGWKSVEMVKRYATFSKEHESTSINKI